MTTNSNLADVLRAAIARVEIANAEGNPILSAWLPDARAAVTAAETTEAEPTKVWCVTLNDRYGDSVQLFTNEAAADAAIWAYLKERWNDEHFGEIPDDLGEAIEAFGYDDATIECSEEPVSATYPA